MRRQAKPKPAMTPSVAIAILRAEREAWRQRLATQVTMSHGGRPMCQYCNAHEAMHMGHYRKNGSAILRKYDKLYTCVNCHNARYGIKHYWGPKYKRDELQEAY